MWKRVSHWNGWAAAQAAGNAETMVLTTESSDQFKLKTKQKKNPRGNCVGTLKQWDKKYVCHVAKSERQTETER